MKQFKINKNFTNRSEESLDRYLVEISRMPMITPEKEVELAQTIRNGGKKGEEAKENATNEFIQKQQRNPSAEELSEIISLEIDKIEKAIESDARVASII